MRFTVHYTQDCYPCHDFMGKPMGGDDLVSLVANLPRSDFMLYIWDNQTGNVVWQSNVSSRFGSVGVSRKH